MSILNTAYQDLPHENIYSKGVFPLDHTGLRIVRKWSYWYHTRHFYIFYLYRVVWTCSSINDNSRLIECRLLALTDIIQFILLYLSHFCNWYWLLRQDGMAAKLGSKKIITIIILNFKLWKISLKCIFSSNNFWPGVYLAPQTHWYIPYIWVWWLKPGLV